MAGSGYPADFVGGDAVVTASRVYPTCWTQCCVTRANPSSDAIYVFIERMRRLPDSGTFFASCGCCVCLCQNNRMELQMNGLIYLIGLIVVIMAVLSLLGLR